LDVLSFCPLRSSATGIVFFLTSLQQRSLLIEQVYFADRIAVTFDFDNSLRYDGRTMCRLLAIIHPYDVNVTRSALENFGALAKNGVTPSGTEPGHRDGWGIVSYEGDAIALLEKNILPATEDPKYLAAARQFSAQTVSLIMGHLRKMTRGAKTMANTQPFTFGPYSFMHNGTLRDAETLSIADPYRAAQQGETDSEIIFCWLVQTIEKRGDFVEGFLEGVRQLRTMDYTALNILMSDGKTIVALREVNSQDAIVKKLDLCDRYYTLFEGRDASGNTAYVSSQKFDITGIVWAEIPNHSALVIPLDGGKRKLIEL
jgi:predicted glutamine amidotransferase